MKHADTDKQTLVAGEDKGVEEIFESQGRSYIVARKRWLIIATVSVLLFLDIFSSTFFSFVNDVTSSYYRIPPALTDVISTVTMISRGSFAILITIFGSRLNLRSSSLIAAGAVIIGGLMIAVGVSSRHNFAILLLGQIICGFGTTTALTLSQLASTNWFPKSEKGKAVAFPWLSRRFSMVVSSLVATNSLQADGPVATFHIAYTGTFLGLAGASLVTFCVTEFIVTDYPPEINCSSETMKKEDDDKPVSEHLNEILRLFKNIPFLLALLFYSLLLVYRPLYDVLLSSIVLAAFPNLNDKFISTMYSIGLAVGAFGGPICGVILDRFQKPKATFLAGLIGMSASCILYSLALYLKNTIALYASNMSMSFTRDICVVCVQHALVAAMEQESTSTRVKAFSLSLSIPWMLVPAYTVAIRQVLEKAGSYVAVLLPLPFMIIIGVIWIFTWKRFYKQTAGYVYGSTDSDEVLDD